MPNKLKDIFSDDIYKFLRQELSLKLMCDILYQMTGSWTTKIIQSYTQRRLDVFSHIRFRPTTVAVKLGARLMKLSDLDSAGQGVSRYIVPLTPVI